MELNDLVAQGGEWLRGVGTDPDIVISSRIRLARNLADFPFICGLPTPIGFGSSRYCMSVSTRLILVNLSDIFELTSFRSSTGNFLLSGT